MDAWSSVGTQDSKKELRSLDPTNPLHSPILDAKDEVVSLTDDLASRSFDPEDSSPTSENIKLQFFRAIFDGDVSAMEGAIASDSLVVNSVLNGFPPLVLAVVFNKISIAEALLSKYYVDPDTADLTKLEHTPLMWAVHFDNLAMAKLLLEYQADPNLAPNHETNISAATLVSLTSPAVYEYFKSHNLLNKFSHIEPFVYQTASFSNQNDDAYDDLTYKIQMLSIEANSVPEPLAYTYQNTEPSEEDDALLQLPDFDYSKALPGQFIKFTDSDIPSLLEYIFSMHLKSRVLQHDARAPAAVIFQLLQYSHTKVGSAELSIFLFDSFISRVRSVTNTKSGVIGATSQDTAEAASPGDIVLLSYWLAVIQFLHMHLTRAKVYETNANFLQTLISVTQNLIAAISFSIDSRLDSLVEDCLLDYTNLVDVSQTFYEKDWNFMKQKKSPKSYDDILDMLYPPSEEQLMLPSPVRYLQVLGALDYVLTLHLVHPLLRFQTYSQVFYYINATMFNRVISNTKYCSRVKAIQIRLNISTLEDWLRSHNIPIYKPDRLGGLELLVDRSNDPNFKFTGLLSEEDNPKSPYCIGFLYNSLYHIGRAQLNPLIELLQWLQVVTGLQDEDTFISTLNELDDVNYYQLYKVTRKMYRYEVNEPKVPKLLIQLLKKLVDQEGQNQINRLKTSYISQSSFLLKELYININPNFVFGIALPNLSELIVSFGAGLGGIDKLRAKKYQPHLPVAVIDDVDEILTENRNSVNETYDYDDNSNSEDENLDAHDLEANRNDRASFDRENIIYKKLEPPLVAHKNYGHEGIDINPW